MLNDVCQAAAKDSKTCFKSFDPPNPTDNKQSVKLSQTRIVSVQKSEVRIPAVFTRAGSPCSASLKVPECSHARAPIIREFMRHFGLGILRNPSYASWSRNLAYMLIGHFGPLVLGWLGLPRWGLPGSQEYLLLGNLQGTHLMQVWFQSTAVVEQVLCGRRSYELRSTLLVRPRDWVLHQDFSRSHTIPPCGIPWPS